MLGGMRTVSPINGIPRNSFWAKYHMPPPLGICHMEPCRFIVMDQEVSSTSSFGENIIELCVYVYCARLSGYLCVQCEKKSYFPILSVTWRKFSYTFSSPLFPQLVHILIDNEAWLESKSSLRTTTRKRRRSHRISYFSYIIFIYKTYRKKSLFSTWNAYFAHI